MFGPRRRGYGHRRGFGGGGSFGLMLLGMQLVGLFRYLSSRNEFYPVTLVTLGLNILAYFKAGTSKNWPAIREACISVQGVWYQKQWRRLYLAPIYHGSDFHLYYNMASFIWKAISMERHFGTGYFAYIMVVFTVLTNFLYLGINYLLAELFDQWSYIQSCAVGFSGVIFAVKVVTTYMQPRGTTLVMGFLPVPKRLACWFELVIISVLFPNASFVGHLSGILVGLAFISGPLKAIMDLPLSLMSDGFGAPQQQEHDRAYTYAARPTGHRPPDAGPQGNRRRGEQTRPTQDQPYTSYTYSAGTTGYQDRGMDTHNDEELELQEVIQRSMREDNARASQNHPNAAPPSSQVYNEDENERDVQVALERSMADVDPGTPLVEHEPPPPYNPNFHPPNQLNDHDSTNGRSDSIQSTETVIVGNEQREEGNQSLRRRAVGTAHDGRRTVGTSHHGGRETDSRRGQNDHELSRDQLRTARLRRLANAPST